MITTKTIGYSLLISISARHDVCLSNNLIRCAFFLLKFRWVKEAVLFSNVTTVCLTKSDVEVHLRLYIVKRLWSELYGTKIKTLTLLRLRLYCSQLATIKSKEYYWRKNYFLWRKHFWCISMVSNGWTFSSFNVDDVLLFSENFKP
jgi:hypothetical protein